jgi:tetratricopeptide (TPR) repeat protein
LAVFVAALGSSLAAARGPTPPPEPAAAAEPATPEATALEALRGGDRAAAVRALEAAMEAGTASSAARALLGRPAEAQAILAPLADAGEADAVALFNLGRALLALDRVAEAEAALRRAVTRAPRSRATLLLASLLAERGVHAEVVALLRPLAQGEGAAAVEAEDAELAGDVALLFGRSLGAAGDRAGALAHLERATRLLPDRPEPWRALGEALAEVDRMEDAYAALARAREREEAHRQHVIADTERARERVRRAAELRAENRLEEALIALREAIRLSPADPLPRTLEVRLLLDMRRPREALEIAEGLVELTRGDAEALHLRGMANLFLDELAAAERDFRAVLEKTGQHRAAMNALALVLIRRGAREEAERLLQRVLELWPDDAVALRNLQALRPG